MFTSIQYKRYSKIIGKFPGKTGLWTEWSPLLLKVWLNHECFPLRLSNFSDELVYRTPIRLMFLWSPVNWYKSLPEIWNRSEVTKLMYWSETIIQIPLKRLIFSTIERNKIFQNNYAGRQFKSMYIFPNVYRKFGNVSSLAFAETVSQSAMHND